MITIVNKTLGIHNVPNHQVLKLLINICTLLSSVFAIIVSFLIIDYIIINFVRKTKLKNSTNISLLLTCNTCLAIICSSSTLTLMILSTIAGDMNIYNLKKLINSACHIRGYLHFTFINSIYLSYVLQAAFRLCRIAFHEYKCLRTVYSFSCYILAQWITSFLLISPILIASENYQSLIIYLPEEFYCQVPMTSIRGIVFSILSVYFVPLCCIAIIYLWIIIHIQRQSNQYILIIMPTGRRNKRDTIIIKRICVVVIVLLLLGVPSTLYVIAFAISGHLHWTAYRIGWMTISISFALISLSSIYVTPQIYKPIRHMIHQTQSSQRTRSASSSANNILDSQKKSDGAVSKQTMTTSIV